MTPRIMLMDNRVQVLENVGPLLESHGYQVLRAATLAEAETILRTCWIHLGIFDIRMIDEDDAHDTSGLELARKPEFEHIPKVFLTSHKDEEFEYANTILQPGAGGRKPLGLAIISKRKEPGFLVETLAQIFAHQLPMNWDLVIDLDPARPVNIAGLLSSLRPDLPKQHFAGQADELEDLFRMLFFEYDSVLLVRVFWRGEQRIALESLAVKGRREHSLLVTCGLAQAGMNEVKQFDDFAPKQLGRCTTRHVQTERTLHFAASSWELVEANLSELQTLAEIIRQRPERQVRRAFENLFNQTLEPWREQGIEVRQAAGLSDLYRQRWAEALGDAPFPALERNLQQLRDEGYRRNLVEIGNLDGQLQASFPEKRAQPASVFPDPLPCLELVDTALTMPLKFCASPGKLDLGTLLADPQGRVWLTDFAHAGHLPIWHDFACLEVELRGRAAEVSGLSDLIDCEAEVSNPQFLGDGLYVDVPDAELKKILTPITGVQKLAGEITGLERKPYEAVLFLNLLGDLAGYEPAARRPDWETSAWLYRYLLSAAVAKRLLAPGEPEQPAQITVDESERLVIINGRRARLTEAEFTLFMYFYQHANQTVKSKDILRDLFKYDRPVSGDEGVLTTTIHRIRDKIEPDPSQPIYLVNIYGIGYKLVIDQG
jgi:DNA-binding response OmpR family regulator